jgi:beta-glucanase (GH16 family)
VGLTLLAAGAMILAMLAPTGPTSVTVAATGPISLNKTGGVTGTTTSAGVATTPANRPGWKLVWADEFDTPGLVDPKKWEYEEGFLRNRELQYYTRARKENCRVENGTLILEARKESYTPARGKPANYTSASIHTQGKASWLYGRIEMRAKLPQGKGTWPAFWTLGVQGGWPSCGEIDIMEFVGYEPAKVYSTLHWNAGGHKSKGGSQPVNQPWADFHVYAVEWSADKIDSYYDENKYSSIPLSSTESGGDSAFRKPHYIKLNFAFGGDWGAAKGVDDSVLPQKYIIDYVRVYEKIAGAAAK